MAAWLSSTGIYHHKFLPHIPSIHFSTVNSSPCQGLLHNPYTPAPSCCTFQGTCIPVWGMYGCGKDCLILIPFRLPQISCFTLSLKCFSSDSDNCPASVPPPAEGWSSPTNILGFPPSSFCVVLYILFHWSGPPVLSQLVLCMHFCV